jgi:hypothetical protein
MFKGEPDWSTKQLLDEIKGEAVRGADKGNLNYLMPAFAALLIKLVVCCSRCPLLLMLKLTPVVEAH